MLDKVPTSVANVEQGTCGYPCLNILDYPLQLLIIMQDQEGGLFPLLQSSKMHTNMKIWYNNSNVTSSAGISGNKTYLLHLPLHV
jgi:hypothetical protein